MTELNVTEANKLFRFGFINMMLLLLLLVVVMVGIYARHSYSDQTWIPNDEVLPLITRTKALTQLGPFINAEHMQVTPHNTIPHHTNEFVD